MKETIFSFDESLRCEKKKSENTIRTYLESVDQFLRLAKHVPPDKVDVQNYLKNLDKLSASTKNVRLSALSAYFEYKQFTDLLTYINTLERETPVNEPVVSALNPEKLAKMRTYFLDQGNMQITLIFDLLNDYGLRVSEALALRKKHFNFEEDRLAVPMSKTKRYRELLLTPHVKESYLAYLESADVKDYLFLSGDKSHDNGLRHKVRRQLLRCEKKLKIEAESSHKFRHYRATMQSHNMSAFELQSFFGWKTLSIATTYVNVDLKRINNKALKALRAEQKAVAVS